MCLGYPSYHGSVGAEIFSSRKGKILSAKSKINRFEIRK
jgi:hypothetical protein